MCRGATLNTDAIWRNRPRFTFGRKRNQAMAVTSDLVPMTAFYAALPHGRYTTMGDGMWGYRDVRTHVEYRFPSAAATCRALDVCGMYDLGEVARYILAGEKDSAHRVLRR